MALQTVGTSPTPLLPQGIDQAMLVQNPGNVSVFLSKDSNTFDSIELTPSGSIVWDAKRPLFGWAPAPTKVNITDNVGAQYNPKVLADLIATGGLAVDIASELYTKGINVVTKYEVIEDLYYSQVVYRTSSYVTSKWSTVYFRFSGGVYGYPFHVTISDVGSTKQYVTETGGQLTVRWPSQSDSVTLTIQSQDGSTPVDYQLYVYGSTQVLPLEARFKPASYTTTGYAQTFFTLQGSGACVTNVVNPVYDLESMGTTLDVVYTGTVQATLAGQSAWIEYRDRFSNLTPVAKSNVTPLPYNVPTNLTLTMSDIRVMGRGLVVVMTGGFTPTNVVLTAKYK